jgi:hypothetical protein
MSVMFKGAATDWANQSKHACDAMHSLIRGKEARRLLNVTARKPWNFLLMNTPHKVVLNSQRDIGRTGKVASASADIPICSQEMGPESAAHA